MQRKEIDLQQQKWYPPLLDICLDLERHNFVGLEIEFHHFEIAAN